MASLGELEQKVMREIWKRGESSVASVCSVFDDRFAYTTVMTTLDRLFKKGLLSRRKDGRAFLYSALYSIEEMERGVAGDLIAKLLDTTIGKAEPVLACIVDSVSDRDRQLLDELERLVIEKRRQLDKGDEK